jgi:serine/threonine-protein kinase
LDDPVRGELGRYRLIAEIARGGMGIVYLALMPGAGGFYKTLVIKELKPELSHNPEFLGMFHDEARIAARLQHPNIVQVNEVDSVGDRHFIAMEYLEGCTLRRAIKKLGSELTLGMHLGVLSEILRGLHHAHELTDESGASLGLVHRDMNPHNIFLTFDGQAKIVDFGIVKTLDSSQHTEVGVFKGKVAYMPPEQAMPDIRVDRRADIYAMGVMLWEAITGRRFWKGLSDIQILTTLIQRKPMPSLDEVKPDTPAGLKRICARALAWDREERYATAEEFRADIDKYVTSSRANVSTRDLGALLARTLEEPRTKMKALVDRKIAQLKSSAGNPTVMSIAPPSISTGLEDPDESGPIAGVSVEEIERLREAVASQRTLASTTEDVEAENDLATSILPSRWRLVWPQILGAVGILMVVLYFGLVRSKPSPSTTINTQPITSAVRPNPIIPEFIGVEVRVAPRDAIVTIDDKRLSGSPPYSVQFIKGSTSHVARAAAPGYTSKTQEFTSDRDVLIDLSLAPSASQPAPTPQPLGQVVTPRPSAQTDPGLRPIDTSNPYNQGQP